MRTNYMLIIFIIIAIFMINKNMNKPLTTEKVTNIENGGGDVNIFPFAAPLKKKVVETINKVLPNQFKEDKPPVSVITDVPNQVVNMKKINQMKDTSGITPNPEGTTEFRFVDENPKTAWSTINVSEHPQYYTSNFEGEKIDTSGFFNQDKFYHDNTSPHSKKDLPDRCMIDVNNKVMCNYNDRLQIIPPKLITDVENNLVLNSIGQGKGDIFKTVDHSVVNNVNGNSYQVWKYENEKIINGGKYFNDVVASSDVNERYMDIKNMRGEEDYSF